MYLQGKRKQGINYALTNKRKVRYNCVQKGVKMLRNIIKAICVLIFICGLLLFISETHETAPLMEQVWLWLKGLGLMVLATVIGVVIDTEEEDTING